MTNRPNGTFGRDCAVCGKQKPQRNWSTLPTCGLPCGLQWAREQRAANRRRALIASGVHTMKGLNAYARGYKAGYQRGLRARPRVLKSKSEAA